MDSKNSAKLKSIFNPPKPFIVPRPVVKVPGYKDNDQDETKAEYHAPEPPTFLEAVLKKKKKAQSALARFGADDLAEVRINFCVPFARTHGVSDAIIHRYLQEQQQDYAEHHQPLHGKYWLPGYSHQRIFDELRCFKARNLVSDAVNRLKGKHLIETETTGQFVEPELKTGRKRDLATWFHVPEPMHDEGIISFNAADARKLDIPKAIILATFENTPITKHDKEGNGYRKLSAVELEKVLPYMDQTIGNHLGKMIAKGVLIPHPAHPKHYRLAN